jgi:putative oxidoreductase
MRPSVRRRAAIGSRGDRVEATAGLAKLLVDPTTDVVPGARRAWGDRNMETESSSNVLVNAGSSKSPLTLTALRVGVGLIMIVHGWVKLMDVSGWTNNLEQLGVPVPAVAAWVAIAGEFLGGAGLLLGLLTPVAAFGVLATMLTAIVTVHTGHGLLAENNGFEYPMTIALVAAYFMARGAGPLSVDAWIQTRRERPTAPSASGHRHPSTAH